MPSRRPNPPIDAIHFERVRGTGVASKRGEVFLSSLRGSHRANMAAHPARATMTVCVAVLVQNRQWAVCTIFAFYKYSALAG